MTVILEDGSPWSPPLADHPCPKCGADVLLGYGLAAGGMGGYEFCDRTECDYFRVTSRESIDGECGSER